ncbi:MAG: carbon monoxide dehydrogenase subunit G [Chloroflexota bacterium]
MKLAGEYTFDAPQQMVWDAVRDPDVLGQILPGGEGISEIGDNEYEGNLKMKVGPVNGKFKGKIKLLNINAPDSYDIEVDGKGAPGFVKATGNLQLTADGADKTNITYSGDAKVGGRIASVGQRLLDTSAKAIVRQSLDLLNEYLKAKVEAQATVQATAEAAGATEAEVAEAVAEAEVEFEAPSQAKLAADLAKDVAGEVVPRPVLYGIIALVVLAILYFVLFVGF